MTIFLVEPRVCPSMPEQAMLPEPIFLVSDWVALGVFATQVDFPSLLLTWPLMVVT